MKKRNLITLIALIFILLIDCNVNSQTKITPHENPSYYNLNSSGDQSTMKLSTRPLPVKEFSAEKNRLLAELRAAREQNNDQLAESIHMRLNEMDGVTSAEHPSDPQAHFELNKKQQDPYEPDYSIIQVNNISAWSGAIAIVPPGAPGSGNLWVANAQFANAGDTIKFYYSTTGGTTWNYYGSVWLNSNNDFYHDELDIDIVFDGTNIWLYGVGGYRDYTDNRDKCLLFRVNIAAGTGYVNVLSFPGSASVNNNYYNPRICTDNSNYTTSTYMYVVCSLDSLTGGNHAIKQQYVYLSSIFNPAPVYNYRNPSNQTGFYWSNGGTPSRIYLYGDIGYYRDFGGSNSDRIMTVFNDGAYGFNSMYLAYSSDFGNTVGGNIILAESLPTKDARICFNGGPAYRTGMVSYRRMFPASDWDPMTYNTTTGGTTAGSWAPFLVDGSNASTRSCDVMAVRGSNNAFKMAYAQENGTLPSVYNSSFNGTAWSAPLQVSNIQADTTFRRPRAAYLTGLGDDCITLWSNGVTAAQYVSKLCLTTVSTEGTSNQIADKYSLQQNYPNPFNPTTTIKFSIPKTSMVTLVVYDAAGKVAAELINKTMTQGFYNIDFDASNLSSGVYFYKLEVRQAGSSTGDYSDVKKMVLIK